jgi:hypothetical protein
VNPIRVPRRIAHVGGLLGGFTTDAIGHPGDTLPAPPEVGPDFTRIGVRSLPDV